jgi:hypothetical protein
MARDWSNAVLNKGPSQSPYCALWDQWLLNAQSGDKLPDVYYECWQDAIYQAQAH